jgi:hypothetical protein
VGERVDRLQRAGTRARRDVIRSLLPSVADLAIAGFPERDHKPVPCRWRRDPETGRIYLRRGVDMGRAKDAVADLVTGHGGLSDMLDRLGVPQ